MAQTLAKNAAALPPHAKANLTDEILRRLQHVLPPRGRPYPLHEPYFGGNERDYVRECLDTGWVSSVGAFVDRFEADLSAYTGAHAVATINGTAALHICLLLAGVRPGDEVLVPALTFVATANAVVYCGAQPHFVDSENDTFGPDPDKLAAYLGRILTRRNDAWVNRRTDRPVRAVMATHCFGHPPKLDALQLVADRYGLPLIEDAAEALGTYYRDTHAGAIGRLGALSFNGNKTITTGGGGAVLTKEPALAARAKHLTTTARTGDPLEWAHDACGYNYRLPNINAALGCAQLEQMPRLLRAKRHLAADYAAAFDDLAGVTVMHEPPDCRSNYWLNVLLLPPDQADARRITVETLNAAGYRCRPFWTPLHRLPMYREAPAMALDTVEDLFQRGINLPSSPALRLVNAK